jgi:hypothetical protein
MSLAPPLGELRTMNAVASASASAQFDCAFACWHVDDVVDLWCDGAGRFREILVERALDQARNGTRHLDHGVAPVILVLRVAHPLVTDTDAPGKRHGSVDDQNLAMRAVVHLLDRVPPQRVEPGDPATGLFQLLQMLPVDPAAADRVDDQVHAHASSRGPCEGASERLSHLARLVDIGLEADTTLRTVNGGQHRREDLLAVGVDREAVAVGELYAEEPREIGGVLRLGGADSAAQVERDLVLDQEQHHRDQDGEEHDDQRHSANGRGGHGREHCKLRAAVVTASRWLEFFALRHGVGASHNQRVLGPICAVAAAGGRLRTPDAGAPRPRTASSRRL